MLLPRSLLLLSLASSSSWHIMTKEKVIKYIMQEFEEPFIIMTTGIVDEGES